MIPQDGSCQKLRICIYIVKVIQIKPLASFFRTRCRNVKIHQEKWELRSKIKWHVFMAHSVVMTTIAT